VGFNNGVCVRGTEQQLTPDRSPGLVGTFSAFVGSQRQQNDHSRESGHKKTRDNAADSQGRRKSGKSVEVRWRGLHRGPLRSE